MDALADALDTAWRLLEAGAADRRNPMHVPVVASVDEAGAPDARVMVLRAVDRIAETLRFHTDARSPKCAAMAGRRVSVLAYDPGAAVQLRNALKADFDHVAAALRRGDIPMGKIVTHRTTLAGAVRDIPVWAHQKQGLVKAVIAV